MGKNFLRLINSSDSFRLVAVVDPIKDSSEIIIQEEIYFYTELEDCLNSEQSIPKHTAIKPRFDLLFKREDINRLQKEKSFTEIC